MIVSGISTSRLSELRKYTISNDLYKKYVTGGTLNSDGIVTSASTSNNIKYYIGGIEYVDVLTGVTSGTTYIIYNPQGSSDPDNFINVPYFKNPNKDNIILNPKVNNDVFINRQEISAFDQNYRLEFIKNLSDLTTFAGGNFFNIVSNT